eukprot:g1380.t1
MTDVGAAFAGGGAGVIGGDAIDDSVALAIERGAGIDGSAAAAADSAGGAAAWRDELRLLHATGERGQAIMRNGTGMMHKADELQHDGVEEDDEAEEMSEEEWDEDDEADAEADAERAENVPQPWQRKRSRAGQWLLSARIALANAVGAGDDTQLCCDAGAAAAALSGASLAEGNPNADDDRAFSGIGAITPKHLFEQAIARVALRDRIDVLNAPGSGAALEDVAVDDTTGAGMAAALVRAPGTGGAGETALGIALRLQCAAWADIARGGEGGGSSSDDDGLGDVAPGNMYDDDLAGDRRAVLKALRYGIRSRTAQAALDDEAERARVPSGETFGVIALMRVFAADVGGAGKAVGARGRQRRRGQQTPRHGGGLRVLDLRGNGMSRLTIEVLLRTLWGARCMRTTAGVAVGGDPADAGSGSGAGSGSDADGGSAQCAGVDSEGALLPAVIGIGTGGARSGVDANRVEISGVPVGALLGGHLVVLDLRGPDAWARAAGVGSGGNSAGAAAAGLTPLGPAQVWPRPCPAGSGALCAELGDAEVELLARALPSARALRDLDVRSNAFGVAAARRLVRVVEGHARQAGQGPTAAERRAEAVERELVRRLAHEEKLRSDPGAWVKVMPWNPRLADGTQPRMKPRFKERRGKRRARAPEPDDEAGADDAEHRVEKQQALASLQRFCGIPLRAARAGRLPRPVAFESAGVEGHLDMSGGHGQLRQGGAAILAHYLPALVHGGSLTSLDVSGNALCDAARVGSGSGDEEGGSGRRGRGRGHRAGVGTGTGTGAGAAVGAGAGAGGGGWGSGGGSEDEEVDGRADAEAGVASDAAARWRDGVRQETGECAGLRCPAALLGAGGMGPRAPTQRKASAPRRALPPPAVSKDGDGARRRRPPRGGVALAEAVARESRPFTGSDWELLELVEELDPDGKMSSAERAELVRKWQGLTPEQAELPTARELKLNREAYERQLEEVQAQLKAVGISRGAAAALKRKETEIREGLKMLAELQDEMMMDIVLKKLASLATEKRAGGGLISGPLGHKLECVPVRVQEEEGGGGGGVTGGK